MWGGGGVQGLMGVGILGTYHNLTKAQGETGTWSLHDSFKMVALPNIMGMDPFLFRVMETPGTPWNKKEEFRVAPCYRENENKPAASVGRLFGGSQKTRENSVAQRTENQKLITFLP